jgi:ABC-type antimicrobial peptide transport system permease subunit
MERRGELALMRCLGFTERGVRRILTSEYIGLIAAGMIYGIAASLAAIWPNLQAATVEVPWKTMLWLTLGISASSVIFTFLAIHLSTKDEIISSLRQE